MYWTRFKIPTNLSFRRHYLTVTLDLRLPHWNKYSYKRCYFSIQQHSLQPSTFPSLKTEAAYFSAELVSAYKYGNIVLSFKLDTCLWF
jgi:hypothetical protein